MTAYRDLLHRPALARLLASAGLASAQLAPFLARQGQTDDLSIIRPFRAWVRQHLVPPPAQPPTP